MGAGKLLTTLVILVINFLLMIFLEKKLESLYTLELVIIVIGMLLALILLIGIAMESRWAWPFGTIFFSLSLANAVFLFWNVGAWLSFVLMLLFNVFGLLMSVLSIGEPDDDWEPMQDTLQVHDEPKEVAYSPTKVKASKKKTKKKR